MYLPDDLKLFGISEAVAKPHQMLSLETNHKPMLNCVKSISTFVKQLFGS